MPKEFGETTVVVVFNGRVEKVFCKISPKAIDFLKQWDRNITRDLESEDAKRINRELFREDIEKTQELTELDLADYL